MPKRIGTLLFFLLILCLSFGRSFAQQDTTGQKGKWIPSVLTHQQKLSRTSIMMQFLGSAVAPSLAAEYSMIKREKLSFDLRGAAWAYPFDRIKNFSFSIGPQIQYGKGVNRFVCGIGFRTFFQYGREHIGQGSFSSPKILNTEYSSYLMLGYRAQHKHGFFFEVDALMFAPGLFLTRNERRWPVSPWAGLVFGYRLPSKLMRAQWKVDGTITKEERNSRRDAEKQAKLIERQNLDPSIRAHGQFYLEGFGVAPWTLNHEYIIPLHRSGIPMFSVRTGIGYTSSLSIPIGIGIGGMKNGHGGFLVGGLTIVPGNGLSPYFGVNFQVHAGKNITVGFAAYGLINPNWIGERLFIDPVDGLVPMAGITLGYRLWKYRP